MVTAPARREVVREMVTRGLSERRALTVVHMSAAALRYVPRPDPIPAWATASSRSRIASPIRRRHDLPEAAPGRTEVNHKRVERLYAVYTCISDLPHIKRSDTISSRSVLGASANR